MIGRPPSSPLFPSTTLFRSHRADGQLGAETHAMTNSRRSPTAMGSRRIGKVLVSGPPISRVRQSASCVGVRSEEHTSELQSHLNLVCRLLLEKKKIQEQQAR